jgi:hypothetical protein
MEEIKVLNNKAYKLLDRYIYNCDCDSCDHSEGCEACTEHSEMTWSVAP